MGELHQALLTLHLQLHLHRAPGKQGGGGAGAHYDGAGQGSGWCQDHEPHHGRGLRGEASGVHRDAGMSSDPGAGEEVLGGPEAVPV